jgi:signal transduction histidine kinase
MTRGITTLRFERLWRRSGWSAIALALALVGVQIVGSRFAAHGQPDLKALDAVAITLLAAGPVVLVGLRRHPALMVWGVHAITLLYLILGYPYGPIFLSMIAAIYIAVREGHRLAAWLATGTLFGAHFLLRLVLDLKPAPSWMQAFAVGAWLVVVLVASEVIRARREHTAEAERTHEEEERRRASEERLRIARELHDVLAHHISLMNVQAGVALHLMEKRPEQARIALTAIEGASREAMGELRSVLNILSRPDEPAPRAPAPSLTRVDSLVAQAAAAGIDVHTEVAGEPRPLPAPLDAAAFRIVQEALTNVVRHADASAATVQICYGPRDLILQIDDNGEGGAAKMAQGGGNGIPGMRARASALGGELDAGRLPGRGFRVRARLPEDGS